MLHCHHEKLHETLRQAANDRIKWILEDKPDYEQALRLRLFRPITVKLPKHIRALEAARVIADKECDYTKEARIAEAVMKATDQWIKKHHPKVCPNCPWKPRRETIF